MDDGVNKEDNKGVKMGATSNPNSAKLASLQARKKVLEETLAKHNQELRKLCIQEAELTGVMPIEYPLEPGESLPSFRRRIGTSFQLPQNVINNLNNVEEISALEVEMQVLSKMAEAALGLANDNNLTKTVRRTNMADYQHHKQRYNELEEKLHYLKTRIPIVQEPKQPSPVVSQPPKQRKKPRPHEQEDAISVSANSTDPFGKPVFRHSLRSLQHPTITQDTEYRYHTQGHQKLGYKSSDSTSLNENIPQYLQQDDPLISAFYKLSLNGYKEYVDRHENIDNLSAHMQNQYMHSQQQNLLYKQHQMQYPNTSNTLPHVSRRSPQSVSSYNNQYQMNNNPHVNTNNFYRQVSPSTSTVSSMKYYPMQAQHVYKQYNIDPARNINTANTHQLQPHQQYEHNVMTSGLGGYWKRSENGEMLFWCNSSSNESTVHKDKRFGSLDRRKNKRVQKRLSPNVDPKSATLAVPMYHEQIRPVSTKPQQVVSRQRHDRQLVRTQSLGSVGAQTVDSVCPSDDSSCGSETLSYTEHNNIIRKHKQKEWYETSLDGPNNSSSSISRSHSTIPSIAPEDKYVEYTSPLPSPRTPTHFAPPPSHPQTSTTPQQSTPKVLEIPAESNPSPRVLETNLEIFNNNIPKNGTVVQQAQWKPYHEETKPFEMSDFYKYSTKFKRSPQKSIQEEHPQNRTPTMGFRNLPSPQALTPNSETFEDDNSVIQKGVYQPLQPMKCQPFSPLNNSNTIASNVGSPLNASLDLSRPPNVAENFSAEMNAWYQNHEHQTESNNATLV